MLGAVSTSEEDIARYGHIARRGYIAHNMQLRRWCIRANSYVAVRCPILQINAQLIRIYTQRRSCRERLSVSPGEKYRLEVGSAESESRRADPF